jgi:hypothetical protein
MKNPPTAWLNALYSDGSPLWRDGVGIDEALWPLYAQHDYLIVYPDMPQGFLADRDAARDRRYTRGYLVLIGFTLATGLLLGWIAGSCTPVFG